MQSIDPLNLHMENILVDYIKNRAGFNFIILWNYPEAELNGIIYVQNITFYYSSERVTLSDVGAAFYYRGPGDVIINNFISLIWFNRSESFGMLQVSVSPLCLRSDFEKPRYYNITDSRFELQEQRNGDINIMFMPLLFEIYRKVEIFITRVSAVNIKKDVEEAIYIIGSVAGANVTIKESYISNVSTRTMILIVKNINQLNILDMHVEESEFTYSYLITFQGVQSVNMSNITVSNMNLNAIGEASIFYINSLNNGTLTIENFKALNSYLGDSAAIETVTINDFNILHSVLGMRPSIESSSSESQSVVLTDLYFSNVTTMNSQSLIRIGTVNNFEAKRISINKSSQQEFSDDLLYLFKICKHFYFLPDFYRVFEFEW
jgi:hypothetical protein